MTVPTAQAEWALGRLTARYREHRSAAGQRTTRGRHLDALHGTRDANAVVDLVAVAESFAVARWSTFASAAAGMTWAQRRKQWLAYDVDLDACSVSNELDGYIAARNAVQHNLGRLTDFQLGKYKMSNLAALAAAGIELNGDVVVLRGWNVYRCTETCQQFIRWLDVVAPQPHS